MGWDAYASIERSSEKFIIKNMFTRKLFKDATQRVQNKTTTADGFLSAGALDCSQCAQMLTKATGASCYSDGWTVEEVQGLAKDADWDFNYDPDKAWAYESAKEFLTLCAKLKLSIYFSY